MSTHTNVISMSLSRNALFMSFHVKYVRNVLFMSFYVNSIRNVIFMPLHVNSIRNARHAITCEFYFHAMTKSPNI